MLRLKYRVTNYSQNYGQNYGQNNGKMYSQKGNTAMYDSKVKVDF